MPLVNAFLARRVILRMMRRERHRGSQLNRRADEPLSVVGHQSAMFGVALDAGPCGRWPDARSVGPWRRTEGVPCGTDVMMSTYACGIPASTLFERSTIADHRVVAETVPRGGVVNARRPGRRPGRSEAKSIDDAEHGASMKVAMVRCLNLVLKRDVSAGEHSRRVLN